MKVLLFLICFILFVYVLRLFLKGYYKPKKCPNCKNGYIEREMDDDDQFVKKCDTCEYVYESGWYRGGID